MQSMYDILMDFPLFKGISREQLSELLEKTHADFVNYHTSDVIFQTGDPCNEIYFIVSGKVKQTTEVCENIFVNQTCQTGATVGAENLFGWSLTYPFMWQAITDVSLFRVRKEQYIKILNSHDIYLMNCLNYLAIRPQRIAGILEENSSAVQRCIALWLASFTDSRGKEISLHCPAQTLADYLDTSLVDVQTQLQALCNKGLLNTSEQDVISITDRRDFV